MNISRDVCRDVGSRGQRGAARLNLVIFLVIVAAVVYAGYQYVPVAYHASLYKVYMQDTVDKAVATGQSTSWVETQFRASAAEYDVPPNAAYKIELRDGRMQASVHWTRPISLPGYTYQYDFNHTVKSANFLTSK